MTNLDRILKSRDITLSTKVHLVKAMVFPVLFTTEKIAVLETVAHIFLVFNDYLWS